MPIVKVSGVTKDGEEAARQKIGSYFRSHPYKGIGIEFTAPLGPRRVSALGFGDRNSLFTTGLNDQLFPSLKIKSREREKKRAGPFRFLAEWLAGLFRRKRPSAQVPVE